MIAYLRQSCPDLINLLQLNHPGNFLLICRDNIWPETNGEELVTSGILQGVAFWREQIRKAIPPHPENADEVSMVNYFNVISELRDQVVLVYKCGQEKLNNL